MRPPVLKSPSPGQLGPGFSAPAGARYWGWGPQFLHVRVLRVKTAVLRKEESVSSLRKQYEVSGGVQPAPAPPALGLRLCPRMQEALHLPSSPLPHLCCRRPCRELSAWKPSWSSSESSCWPPNDCCRTPTLPGRAVGALGTPGGGGRVLSSLPPTLFFTAWSQCHVCDPAGTLCSLRVVGGYFTNKPALVSTALLVPSVSPGRQGGLCLTAPSAAFSLLVFVPPHVCRCRGMSRSSSPVFIPAPCSCTPRPSPGQDVWELRIRLY